MAEHVPACAQVVKEAIIGNSVSVEGSGQRFMPARVDETDEPFFLSSIPYYSSYEKAVCLWLTISLVRGKIL